MIPEYSAAFEAAYTYTGNDLGALWQEDATVFRVWAPTAQEVQLALYETGTPGQGSPALIPMQPDVCGTWTVRCPGNLHGRYYTYRVAVDGVTQEVCDPYARTTGVNGCRAMVLDLRTTDPDGWAQDTPPHPGIDPTDAVIYELHLRDISVHPHSGVTYKGKFLGLAQPNTKSPVGHPTALSHILSLGVTHVQLLPIYDYGSVDEASDTPQYNWGYDPVNYNAPEGSYATDPYRGTVRVKELKQLIKTLHENGLGVVMDVVYNHVYSGEDFCINRIVPGYFSRGNANGSGCGNDTASERAMVRKYIVDSVNYWADEYHLDGFRFDLVGLLDVDTVNQILRTVHARHPHVIFYGEGWTLPTQTDYPCQLAVQQNAQLTPRFGYFNDTLRDILRGYVFDDTQPGFVSGAPGLVSQLQRCFTALPDWCPTPAQAVNYASCHDNMALFDRIVLSAPQATHAQHIAMNCLAAAVYMTCRGIAFFQAGEELLRSKPLPAGGFDHNSYRSPDSVNAIRWDGLEAEETRTVCDYYRGLIALRKAHSVLRGGDNSAVIPLDTPPAVAAFLLQGENTLLLAFHPGGDALTLPLPEGNWDVLVHGDKAGTQPLFTARDSVQIPPISAAVLLRR